MQIIRKYSRRVVAIVQAFLQRVRAKFRRVGPTPTPTAFARS